MVDQYALLPSMLAGFIGGFICPNRRSHGFLIGWSCILEEMVGQRMIYAWEIFVLAHLYHDLHQVVYDEVASLSTWVILLHI